MQTSRFFSLLIVCLLTSKLVSQASNVNLHAQGESSSARNTSHYRTPLQIDAEEFLAVWKPEALRGDVADVQGNQFIESVVNYINIIIVRDRLVEFNAPHTLDYEDSAHEHFEHGKSIKNFPVDNRQLALPILNNNLKDLINKQFPNTFASYFLGYALAAGRKPEDYSAKITQDIRMWLGQASRKHYIRAINLLLENPQWAQDSLDNNKLSLYKDILLEPKKAIYNYILNHSVKGQLSWEDVKDLEDIFVYHTNNPDEYFRTYSRLAQRLRSTLILRKEKESPLRLLEFVSLNFIGSTAVLLTQGIINNTLAEERSGTTRRLFETIGTMQIATSAISGLATFTSYPYVSNLFYRWEGWSLKGKLLPSSYSDEEISLQSHLIALYGSVLNKDQGRNSIHKELSGKGYTNKIRKFILNSFDKESSALSSAINVEVADSFKLNN